MLMALILWAAHPQWSKRTIAKDTSDITAYPSLSC